MKTLFLTLIVVALAGCNALGSKSPNTSLKPTAAQDDLYRGGGK